MKTPGTILRDNEVHDAFGVEYLQTRIEHEFPLARHLEVLVDAAHDGAVVVRAPLTPNANHKGTAFGGSLFCVAVLAGWAWATRFIEAHGVNADAVIQESTIRYLKPVGGEFRATAKAPPPEQLDRFLKMLARSGRGRVRLQVEILDGQTLAARFDGVFVAALRRGPVFSGEWKCPQN